MLPVRSSNCLTHAPSPSPRLPVGPVEERRVAGSKGSARRATCDWGTRNRYAENARTSAANVRKISVVDRFMCGEAGTNRRRLRLGEADEIEPRRRLAVGPGGRRADAGPQVV